MNPAWFLLRLWIASGVFAVTSAYGEPVDCVDPFIGTRSGRWFFFAPAALPFGLVKLAPDTCGYGGYQGGGYPAGYRYGDTSIVGFSHIHEFQLGGFLLMPTTGALVTTAGAENQSAVGWRSSYVKKSERAEPGYYSVYLDKYSTGVELTATTRAGYHRYTFPEDTNGRIILDVGRPLGEGGLYQDADFFRAALRSACVQRLDSKTLCASITLAPSYAEGPVTVYAFLRFSRPFSNYGAYREGFVFPARDTITGFGAGYYLEFDAKGGRTVEVQVGLSYVSTQQAERNLSAEIGSCTFDEIRARARRTWNSMLSRIEVPGDLPEERENKTKLYTALWHALLGRGVSSDADGSYLDVSGRRRQIPLKDGIPEFDRYNTDALWGSFWNLNQVWALLYPERMTSFAKFLLSVYQETGWLPDGFVGNQRAPGMLSNQATPFLAAAFDRDPRAFDSDILWAAIWRNQTEWRDRPRFSGNECLAGYSERGFVACDEAGIGPTGYTLEYSFEDWCAAQVARKLGKSKEEIFLLKRAKGWMHHWDANERCFRPRRFNGEFYSPFDKDSGFSFCEGTPRQYRWFVPHDIPALVQLYGKDAFLAELHAALSNAETTGFGPKIGDSTAGYSLAYNHGNQPDLHAAWLFHFVNRPDLTHYFVHEICERFYGITIDHGYGAGQDEDQGQLGAWFVLGAIGLFDVEGGGRPDGSFAVIPPLFRNIKLHLGAGSAPVLTIASSIESGRACEGVLNGNMLTGSWVQRHEILKGGALKFEDSTGGRQFKR